MRNINKRKLYGFMSRSGMISSMIGLSSFLTSYFSMNRMDPAITLASVGLVGVGGVTSAIGYLKEKKYFYENIESDDETYDNIYDLDLLELRKEELKKVQTRFDIEKINMDDKSRYIISRNILKEKLLIKKVLEELDTDIPSIEEECNLIVSMILDTSYDDEYLDYKNKVLTSNVVDFPKIENESYNNTSTGSKLLHFPKKQ
ncbi:MAG: hypothetical protein J6O56_04885 [Bacilli bacterium]|nr:hypothetical protein [Bacilli bacterium]